MATNKQFLGGRIILGTEFAGYLYRIYEPGTSTFKTTYKDSNLTAGNENQTTITLDANGACQIWFDGNADSVFLTPDGVVVYSDPDVSLSDSLSETGTYNLVLNNSFEDDSDGDGIPNNWTRTLYTDGTFTVDTTTQNNGSSSVKFTSIGTGGGYISSTNTFAVSPSVIYTIGFSLKSSDAGVRNLVEILWYKADGSASATASTTILDDSTTNPTSWTEKWYQTTSPSDAFFARYRLTGCHSSDSTVGSTWYDSVYFSDASINRATTTFSVEPTFLKNCRIAPTVGSNALTVAIKGNDGNDLSATNICQISFRSTTVTSAALLVRNILSSTSIVLPQGGTLGFINAETGFIYVYLVDDGSTRQVGIAKRALFSEGGLHTTTSVGTGSDSASTLYTTAGVSGAAVRLIGRITIATGATAGDWSNSPTVLEPWTPTMKKTGDIVQIVNTHTGETASGTTTIPNDDTIPQSGEGDEYITREITPRNALNRLIVESNMHLCSSAASAVNMFICLFQDSGADALAAGRGRIETSSDIREFFLSHEMAAGTASSTTFKMRAGSSSAGTTRLNGSGGARFFGGVLNSYLRITEVQA